MVITKIKGGLGNQLFQYATGRSLARQLGTKLILDTSEYSPLSFRQYKLNHFGISQPILGPCARSAIRKLRRRWLASIRLLTHNRGIIRILEDKGHLKHIKRGREFVYQPTHSRDSAGKNAFARTIQTFFDGSLERAVASYLGDPQAEISPEELQRLFSLIKEARRKERQP